MPAVLYVPMERRKKQDSTGVAAIFIGYDVNGYRLWCPSMQKVICSRDIVVNESGVVVVNDVQHETTDEVNKDHDETKQTEELRDDDEISDFTLTPGRTVTSNFNFMTT